MGKRNNTSKEEWDVLMASTSTRCAAEESDEYPFWPPRYRTASIFIMLGRGELKLKHRYLFIYIHFVVRVVGGDFLFVS